MSWFHKRFAKLFRNHEYAVADENRVSVRPDQSDGTDLADLIEKPKAIRPFEKSDLPQRLLDSSNLLKRSSRNVEPDFLALGRDLQSIFSDVTDLNQQTINAIQIYGGDSENSHVDRVVDLAHHLEGPSKRK